MKKLVVMGSIMVVIIGVFVYVNIPREKTTVDGSGFAGPRQFDEVMLYGKANNEFKYYKPLNSRADYQYITETLYQKINIDIDLKKDLFDYDNKQIILVEHRDKDRLYQHIQIQFLKDSHYFIVLSAYEVNNQSEQYSFDETYKNLVEQYTKEKKDLFNAQVDVGYLNNSDQYIHFLNNNNEEGNLSYMYYYLNDKYHTMSMVCTAASELIFYKDGVLYNLAYDKDIKVEEIMALMNRFIKQEDD